MAARGRPATGSVEFKNGQWRARVTLCDGTRPWVQLDPSISENDEQAARACARDVSRVVREKRVVSMNTRETLNEWSDRWLGHREKQGYKSVKDMKSRIQRIRGVLGTRPMAAITTDEVEDFRDLLDRQIAADELSWKTALHCWSDARQMFKDARASKDRSLRVRDDDPTAGVQPPEKGANKSKAVLYPDEFLKLVGSAAVPWRYRVLYAVAVYTGMRAGELEAIVWSDVDLVHRIINVNKAVNRKTGEVESTKSEDVRVVPIEAELLPLLEAMKHDAVDGDAVLWMPVDEQRARDLRDHLRRAGVTREALFTSDAHHVNVRFHDLRGAHLTWRAVRGDSEVVIMRVAGHTEYQTSLGYIHRAAVLKDAFGTPFPPLPDAIFVRDDGARVGAAPKPARVLAKVAGATALVRSPGEASARAQSADGPETGSGLSSRFSSRVVGRRADPSKNPHAQWRPQRDSNPC